MGPARRGAADVTAWFTNPMVLRQEDGAELLWELGGYYRHRLVRAAQGWRSAERVEELVWKRDV